MKRALAFAAIAAAGIVWMLWPTPRTEPRAPVHRPPLVTQARRAPIPRPSSTSTSTAPLSTAEAPAEVPARVTLQGDALVHRLDDEIPTRLYAEAARCYHGGSQADERLDLEYKLHAAGGLVSITGVRVSDSTLRDRALERCIIDRLQATRFRDDQMPDTDDENDLYLRVGGFKPYLGHVRSDGDDPAAE